MGGLNFSILEIANKIFNSNFILDKIAVDISGVIKEEFIKNYEKNLNQHNQPIIINYLYLDFI